MYMPGRCRMWAASRRICTLSGVYSPLPFAAWISAGSGGVATMVCSSLMAAVSFLSSLLLPYSGTEAQVRNGNTLQPSAEPFHEAAFLEMGQLLHEDGVIDQDLEDAAAQGADARVLGRLGPGGLGPGFFQLHPALPPA